MSTTTTTTTTTTTITTTTTTTTMTTTTTTTKMKPPGSRNPWLIYLSSADTDPVVIDLSTTRNPYQKYLDAPPSTPPLPSPNPPTPDTDLFTHLFANFGPHLTCAEPTFDDLLDFTFLPSLAHSPSFATSTFPPPIPPASPPSIDPSLFTATPEEEHYRARRSKKRMEPPGGWAAAQKKERARVVVQRWRRGFRKEFGEVPEFGMRMRKRKSRRLEGLGTVVEVEEEGVVGGERLGRWGRGMRGGRRCGSEGVGCAEYARIKAGSTA